MSYIAIVRRSLLLMPAAALLAAAPLAAQATDSPELRLARALTQGGPQTQLGVGELPAGFPQEILPPEATILGYASDAWHHRVALTFDGPSAAPPNRPRLLRSRHTRPFDGA